MAEERPYIGDVCVECCGSVQFGRCTECGTKWDPLAYLIMSDEECEALLDECLAWMPPQGSQ